MSRPWMPLYVADYLADTGHLTGAEHGAYLLLIMHYWANDGLPDDDERLARIARMSDKQWAKSKGIIAEFFEDGWKHNRIDDELAKAADISNKRRASAEERHSKRTASADANAHQEHTQSPSPSQPPQNSEPNGSALERELFSRGKQVLGKSSGGVIANLLKAKGGDIALARSVIETASTKQNPNEYVGGAIRAGKGKNGAGNRTMAAFDDLISQAASDGVEEGHSLIDITPRGTESG